MQQDKLKKNFIVVKFGGSNFRNLDGYGEVIHKIFELLNIAYNKKIVVVVSAAYGVTDRLLKALKEFKLLDVKLFIEELYDFHSSFLGVRDDEELRRIVFGLEGLFYGLKFLGKIPDFTRDEILSYGERINAYVLQRLLLREGVEFDLKLPEEWIITDGKFGNASVLLEATKDVINSRIALWEEKNCIVPGFYGVTQDGEITILGRGGSDYTAGVLGYCLNAEYVILFKDVEGFFSGDPKIVQNPRLLESISYEEMEELSYFGAKIVHPSAIEPLKKRNIPLYICNFSGTLDFERCTLVSSNKLRSDDCVKSVSFTDDIAIVKLHGANLGRVPGILGEVSTSISDEGLNIKFVITSQTAINLIISKNDVFDVLRVVERMRTKELEDISYDTDKALVSVVGYGLFDTHGIAAKIFGTLANAQINVEMISAGASQVSMYFLVDVKDGRRSVELIHNALFSGQ